MSNISYIFQITNSFRLNNLSLKYPRITKSGCNDIGIRKSGCKDIGIRKSGCKDIGIRKF